MGYIFDALNRSQPDDEPRREDRPEAGDHPPAKLPPAPRLAQTHAAAPHAEAQAEAADAAAAHADAPRHGPSSAGEHDAPGTAADGADTPESNDAGHAAESHGTAPSLAVAIENPAPAAWTPDDPAGYAIEPDPLAFDSIDSSEPLEPSRTLSFEEARSRSVDDRIVLLTDPGCQFAEEYRAIRTSLLARWQNRRNLVHVVTSATPQEGKTITSLNLGLTMGELRSRRTIVVEADLRLPAFGKLMGLDDNLGLVPYLNGDASLEASTHRIGERGVYVLPAGESAFDDAVSLLSGPRMQSLIDTLRRRFDHVIIDTPPVIELADAGVLGGISDDVLLVARMRRTSKRLIEQAISTLKSYNAPVGGLIATDHTPGFGRYQAYRYRYRYHRYHRYRQDRGEKRAA